MKNGVFMKFNKLFIILSLCLSLNSALHSMAIEPEWSEIWSREVPFSEVEKHCIYNVDNYWEFDPIKDDYFSYSYGKQQFLALKKEKLNKKFTISDVDRLMHTLDILGTSDTPGMDGKIRYNTESYLAGWLKKGMWYKPVNALAKNVFDNSGAINSMQKEQKAKLELSAINKSKISVGIIYALIASGSIAAVYKLIKYLQAKSNKNQPEKRSYKNKNLRSKKSV